jgi:hypothetical protein
MASPRGRSRSRVQRVLTPSTTAYRRAHREFAVIAQLPSPVADDARLNTLFLGNRTRTATVSRQQHYPPLGTALGGARRWQRASGTLRVFGLIQTFLALRSIPFLNHESREQKWMLP